MEKNRSINNHIALFKGKTIRRVIYQKEWYFSVVDVIESLTDSPTPRQYWGKVKQREFIDIQLSPIWVQLKLEAADGKKIRNRLRKYRRNVPHYPIYSLAKSRTLKTLAGKSRI